MKKTVIRGALVALMAYLLAHPASAELNADSDFQYWNMEAIEGKINDKWKAYMEAEFRFGDDASKFYYQHTHLEIGYKVNDWLEIAPGYRQVWELFEKSVDEPGQEDWFAEARPMINFLLKHKWKGWELRNRNRFEYRIFEIDKEDVFRYRNALLVNSPWKWTQWNINPFIADEIFIQENDDFNRNRFYVGVNVDLMEHLTGRIFYLWQTSEKDNEWIDFNIIGTQLKFKF